MSDEQTSQPPGASKSDRQLRIGVLSIYPTSYSVRRLIEEARAAGHQARALDPQKFAILADEDAPRLAYADKLLKPYDVVIPRVSAQITQFGTAVVRQFEQMGSYALNPSYSILASRDKLRAIQMLSRHGIPVPRTALVRAPKPLPAALDHVGGNAFVIKLLEGSQGLGVVLAEGRKSAHSLVEMLQTIQQDALIQSFVREASGTDLRAFVVGGEVVAAMRRTSDGDDFRSNLHRGGTAEGVELSPAARKVAVRAAKVLGLNVAGVDILESNSGPMVIEVNSSPGLEGIEAASKKNVAREVIRCAEELVSLPVVDLHQALNIHSTYMVTETTLGKRSSFIGKSIAKTVLAHPDVQIMLHVRGEQAQARPSFDVELAEGDRLVVFGPRSVLAAVLPKRGKPRASKPPD